MSDIGTTLVQSVLPASDTVRSGKRSVEERVDDALSGACGQVPTWRETADRYGLSGNDHAASADGTSGKGDDTSASRAKDAAHAVCSAAASREEGKEGQSSACAKTASSEEMGEETGAAVAGRGKATVRTAMAEHLREEIKEQINAQGKMQAKAAASAVALSGDSSEIASPITASVKKDAAKKAHAAGFAGKNSTAGSENDMVKPEGQTTVLPKNGSAATLKGGEGRPGETHDALRSEKHSVSGKTVDPDTSRPADGSVRTGVSVTARSAGSATFEAIQGRVSGTIAVREESVLNQIAGHAATLVSRGSGSMKLTLYPSQLGTLDMEVRMKGDTMRVILAAESGEVQKILESGIDRLRNALHSSGLKDENISVTVEDRSQGGFADSSFGKAFSADDRRKGERSSGMARDDMARRSAVDSAAMERRRVADGNMISLFA